MRRDRAAGALLGVTVGDALGATLEFMPPARIAAEHGVHREITGGGAFGWRPGQGTDDSDLTACVARAYADGYDLDRVAERFLAWYRTGPRDIGGLTARALGLLDRHGDPSASGREADQGGSAGNGSLMRAMPTALARDDRRTRLLEAAEISAVTHFDERCVQACQAYVEIAAALVRGATVDDALAAGVAAGATNGEVLDALRVDPRRPVAEIATSGYVVHSLAAAVWAIRQPQPFEDVLVALVNRGDDADTTGAIAGGLLGARDGVDAIPRRWLDVVEYRDEFTALADRLVARP